MAQQLKNTLLFSLAPGASVVLPHGLQLLIGTPLAPDIIFIPSPDLSVESDTINVTLTNDGGSDLAGSVLVEAWHTIERAFGDEANVNLPVKPYIVVSAEPGNEPPQPAFELTTTTIYARLTGSDTDGDGRTPATAFRTFQRAIRSVPSFPAPGARFIVDITGIGTEVLPVQYAMPVITFPVLVYENDYALPYFYSGAGLRVRALPQLVAAIPAAAAEIGSTDGATITADPDTNLITLTITTPRASWTTANLKNKMLIRTIGNHKADCVIVDAPDTKTLVLTNNAADFNGGTGAVVFATGEKLQIVEPSATLQTDPAFVANDYTDFDNAAGMQCAVNSMAFQGIKFTQPGSGFPFALMMFNCPQAVLELCDVDGYSPQGQTGTYWAYASGCVIRNTILAVNSSFFSSACHFDTITLFYMVNGTPQSFANAIFTDCSPYASVSQTGLPIICNSAFQNVRWDGGAISVTGGRIALDHVQINGSPANAVDVLEGSYATFAHVTGTGITGAGANVDDGSHLRFDNGVETTIGNDGPRAYINGGVPVVGGVWPVGAPSQDTNATTLSRVWSPTP